MVSWWKRTVEIKQEGRQIPRSVCYQRMRFSLAAKVPICLQLSERGAPQADGTQGSDAGGCSPGRNKKGIPNHFQSPVCLESRKYSALL